jgi:hypothetical protein
MIEYILNSDKEIEKNILDSAVGELMRAYSVRCSEIIVYIEDFNKDNSANTVVVNPFYEDENLFLLSKKKNLENIVFLNGSDSAKIELNNFRYRINKKRDIPAELDEKLHYYSR